jgi:hypothetical protein
MTSPRSDQPPEGTASPAQVPAGVLIASTLCWVVGILTILITLAVAIPTISSSGTPLFLAVNLLAGGAVCVAAILIRRQRRLGVLVMVLAWALPTLVSVLNHQPARGSLLLFVALLLAGVSWKHFR